MLTDIKIRAARPEEKPYKVYDSRGLYFYITPKGTKSWRFDYKINNKRKTATLGTYPEVSLAEARLKRDELRIQLSKGMSLMSFLLISRRGIFATGEINRGMRLIL